MSDVLRVFVSSTSEDLRAHRDAVQRAILSMHLFPAMMEFFPAEGLGAAINDRLARAAV
mgnify:CR=1 FL=1